MKISVHLSFNGNCEEAFALYARLLEGQVVYSLRYRDSPASEQVPPDWQDKLFHSTLTIGDVTLLGGDLVDFHNAPQGFALVLNPASRDEAEVLFDALAEGGEVAMPLQATSWASAFGVVTDRFGVPWEINCEEPQEAA